MSAHWQSWRAVRSPPLPLHPSCATLGVRQAAHTAAWPRAARRASHGQARRARAPVLPSMPNVAPAPPASACLARSLVSTRMMLAPQFCASVRGMTSSAVPTARYGPCAPARLIRLGRHRVAPQFLRERARDDLQRRAHRAGRALRARAL